MQSRRSSQIKMFARTSSMSSIDSIMLRCLTRGKTVQYGCFCGSSTQCSSIRGRHKAE